MNGKKMIALLIMKYKRKELSEMVVLETKLTVNIIK